MATLREVADRLTERRFDRIHLHGPGTDLTVGLFPSSRWHAAGFETVDGLHHYPNLPTEETFTTPDPDRVDGHVTATMPLELYGSMISGIRVEFAGGRAVQDRRGARAPTRCVGCCEGRRRLAARRARARRRQGRIGPLETVFFDTLIDENAASHIALGTGYQLRGRGRRGQARASTRARSTSTS